MKTLLILLLTIITQQCYCQDKVQDAFRDNVVNTNWSCEDSVELKDYEMMVICFTEDSITHGYINWLDGMYSNRCSYEVKFSDTHCELEIGGCVEPSSEVKYVYGFLSDGNNDELNILMSENKLVVNDKFKQQKGWIRFERFDE
jgi:hypothetical protein